MPGHKRNLCPFCSSPSVSVPYLGSVSSYVATCNGCGARGPVRPSRRQATSAWNRRGDGDRGWKTAPRTAGRLPKLTLEEATLLRELGRVRKLAAGLSNPRLAKVFGLSSRGVEVYLAETHIKHHQAEMQT